MKKITLKDIAKEAHVSVATVSYVLNHVKNQTIPNETKCKVMGIAERMNYIPDLTAKALVKRKTGLIGIMICKEREYPFWKEFQDYQLVSRLEYLLTAKGYHVVVSSLEATDPKLDIVLERHLEGAFLINVRKDVFHRISNHFKFGVPIVVIDSAIEDDLFHKVHFDWTSAIYKAKVDLAWNPSCFLVTEQFHEVGMAE
ncbi:MAG: LacI family transcriptional regulator, partial [Gorillibacterium sp.]|nr:LacI family transcriptional regulator [Gorillibacterium sp.]